MSFSSERWDSRFLWMLIEGKKVDVKLGGSLSHYLGSKLCESLTAPEWCRMDDLVGRREKGEEQRLRCLRTEGRIQMASTVTRYFCEGALLTIALLDLLKIDSIFSAHTVLNII